MNEPNEPTKASSEKDLDTLISDTKSEIHEYKAEHPEVIKPLKDGEDVLDKILNKGVEAFKIWADTQADIKKYESDNNTRLEGNKLDLLKESDKRNGVITLILVIGCLVAMVILSALGKFSTESAVIVAVIITSLFSNKISKTINDISQTFKKTNKIDEN